MPASNLLVDSGFLYALYNRDDKNNEAVNAVAELYEGQFVIPYVVLTARSNPYWRDYDSVCGCESRFR